jgi:hypothetical protein
MPPKLLGNRHLGLHIKRLVDEQSRWGTGAKVSWGGVGWDSRRLQDFPRKATRTLKRFSWPSSMEGLTGICSALRIFQQSALREIGGL